MAEVRTVPPWLRVAFHLPDRLYRHGLGVLLGRRFLRLVHVGRRSGTRYATVLEIVRYDPRGPELVVVSGFGWDADWLRNIRANGMAEVTVGRRTFTADHRLLSPEEAAAVLGAYEHRNPAIRPVVRRVLSWLLGWRYDGSPDARRQAVAQLPLVALRPTGDGAA